MSTLLFLLTTVQSSDVSVTVHANVHVASISDKLIGAGKVSRSTYLAFVTEGSKLGTAASRQVHPGSEPAVPGRRVLSRQRYTSE